MSHRDDRLDRSHSDDGGLLQDLRVLDARTSRRQALRALAGVSLLPLVGCGSSGTGGTSDTADAASDVGLDAGSDAGMDTAEVQVTPPDSCDPLPQETAGPFPGDGSVGPNTLTASGIVRDDIRSSFGGMTGVAEGVPLELRLTLASDAAPCELLEGYAVYVWHCDRDGGYSLYTVADQNYLRGVQATGAAGQVAFTTIFPGCYPGRWPHVHFEVFPSLASAQSGAAAVLTSQLAFPRASCDAAYAAPGYEGSVTNLSQLAGIEADGVFADGADLQTADVSGDAASGFVANLVIGLSV